MIYHVVTFQGFVNKSKVTENENLAFHDPLLPPVRSAKTVDLKANKEVYIFFILESIGSLLYENKFYFAIEYD